MRLIAYAVLTVSSLLFVSSVHADQKRPNVLFIAIDDLNDWIGALGGHPQVQTPHLDKLFDQGVLFTNAHCSQAVCTASRNSLLSGLHPTTSGWYSSTSAMRDSYTQVMGEDHVILPEFFKSRDYQTLAMGKIYHKGVTDYKDREDDFWSETGFSYKIPKHLLERGDGYGGKHFYPFPKQGSQITKVLGIRDGNSLCGGPLDVEDIPDGEMYDEKIAKWAVRRLNRSYEQPFFMAVGFVRPHVPFTAPKKYFDLYNADELSLPKVPDNEMTDIPLMGKAIALGRIKGGDHNAVLSVGEHYWRDLVHSYLACISFVDDQVGKVISALESGPHADNTIVILWSDHGHHLGEKMHWRKQSLWEESTRVPLFIKAPGVTQTGQRRSQAVSLLDIYPTLAELCGFEIPEKCDGESLVPILTDQTAIRRPVLQSWYYGNHAVRSNDWRYIRYRDGTEELYDHRTDQSEHHNLAANPEYSEIKVELDKAIPDQPALPAGQTEWKGDRLDGIVEQLSVGQ